LYTRILRDTAPALWSAMEPELPGSSYHLKDAEHFRYAILCSSNLRWRLEDMNVILMPDLNSAQNPTRVFTNNIVVRFHPSLEMDGDEVITIVCRYPPPVAPPPPLLPGPL